MFNNCPFYWDASVNTGIQIWRNSPRARRLVPKRAMCFPFRSGQDRRVRRVRLAARASAPRLRDQRLRIGLGVLQQLGLTG